jgi:hypothetical protein
MKRARAEERAAWKAWCDSQDRRRKIEEAFTKEFMEAVKREDD